MQHQFYSRYRPSPVEPGRSVSEELPITSRPKKRKRVEVAGHRLSAIRSPEREPRPPQNPDESSASRPSRKNDEPLASSLSLSKLAQGASQKARPSTRKSHSNESAVVDQNALPDGDKPISSIDDKHKTIRVKYQEASKISKQVLRDLSENDGDEKEAALPRIQSKGLQPLPQPERAEDRPHHEISALPGWLTNPIYADKTASFIDLGVSFDTADGLSRAGLTEAFAIQEAVLSRLIPSSRQHRGDICVSASTGSGKTLAYTLPIIEALRNKPGSRLRALIIVPTRELVLQVQEVFRIAGSSLKIGIAIGSKSLKEEQDALIDTSGRWDPEGYRQTYAKPSRIDKEVDSVDSLDEEDLEEPLPTRNNVFEYHSKIDVLICTPGRLVDHIRSTKGFTLEHVQWLVVDEADRLLDQSFQEWIDVVVPKLTTGYKHTDSLASRWHRLSLSVQRPLRKIVLSATMTRDYSKLVALDLFNPILITTANTAQTASGDKTPNGQSREARSMIVPENLSEVAIAIKNASEKPLYLVQWIQESLRIPIAESRSDHDFVARSNQETSPLENSSTSSESDSSSSTDSSSDWSSESDSESSSDSGGSDHDNKINGKNQDIPSPSGSSASLFKAQAESENHRESAHGMLIFTNTNESALRLCRLLSLLQPSWASRISPLTKSMGTSSGRKALSEFRKRKIDILVATDLASRGLDLDQLAHVVNYDMPKSVTTYIHRIGRTARAGRSGIAFTLVAHHEARWFWNEIGRSKAVERFQKVKRRDVPPNFSEHEQEMYEAALERLGKETKGSTDIDMG